MKQGMIVRTGLGLLALLAVLDLGFLAITAKPAIESEMLLNESTRLSHVIIHLNKLSALMQDAAQSLMTSTMSAVGGTMLISVPQIEAEVSAIQELAGNHDDEKQIQGDLQEACRNSLPNFDGYLKAHFDQAGGRGEAARTLLRDSDKIMRLTNDLSEQYRGRLESAFEQRNAVNSQLTTLVCSELALNVVLLLLLLFLFAKGVVERLHLATENSTRLKSGDDGVPFLQGKDEIAQVDKAFHIMAEVLARSLWREKAIVEKAASVICVLDKTSKFKSVSAASLPAWGYRPEELLGQRIELITQNKEIEFAMLTQAPPSAFESRVKRKDGTFLEVLWSARWSQEKNSLYCVAHDITEHKRNEDLLKSNEARIRALIDHLPFAVLISDSTGKIESTNPKGQEIFACERNALTGRQLSDLFTSTVPKMREGDSALSGVPATLPVADGASIASAQAAAKAVKLEALRHNGTLFTASFSTTPLKTNKGERALSIVQDITLLQKAERLKQDLTTVVIDDLADTLTNVQLALGQLANGAAGELPATTCDDIAAAEDDLIEVMSVINSIMLPTEEATAPTQTQS